MIRYRLTPAARSAVWSIHLWEAHWGGPEQGRRAWEALGARLIRPGPFRPAPWWAYVPGVPAELREAVEPPDPRCLAENPVEPPAGYYERERDWRCHQLARLEWLMGSGRLTPSEVAQARRHRLTHAPA